MNEHIVIQNIQGKYEVWAPCSERGGSCHVYHSKVATCDDAERIAKGLDVKP
jgi:hypothetical protein